MSKNALIATIFGLLVIVLGVIFLLPKAPEPIPEPEPEVVIEQPLPFKSERVIGQSVEGRNITAVSLGTGERHLLFVGGMHGGYEWNGVLLAYQMIDYLIANQDLVPTGFTIDIIPDLNPDGTFLATGVAGAFTLADIADPSTSLAEARFNANGVDLNRNFDCHWAPESTWRGNTVSAGTAAFSEPEARALRDFVAVSQPEAVVFWHSQANNVYASECDAGVLPSTITLMNTYGDAAGYGKVEKFDAYPITGDAEGWLASIGIPAVTVELGTHASTEWEKNLAGFSAVVTEYAK